MIKSDYRLYHKVEQRMYNHVKSWEQSFGPGQAVWTVWDSNDKDRSTWPTKKINDDEVIKMNFIGIYDDTKWHDLKEWEQIFWRNRGFTELTWKGKPVFTGDIVKRVDQGKKDKFEAIHMNGSHFLCGKDNCVCEIPYDRTKSKIYVIGNTFQNMDLLEDDTWQPIKVKYNRMKLA